MNIKLFFRNQDTFKTMRMNISEFSISGDSKQATTTK